MSTDSSMDALLRALSPAVNHNAAAKLGLWALRTPKAHVALVPPWEALTREAGRRAVGGACGVVVAAARLVGYFAYPVCACPWKGR